jgi:hypothetical protein
MKKKVKINYYEDADMAKYLKSLPFHTMSVFIRDAVKVAVKKAKKLSPGA